MKNSFYLPTKNAVQFFKKSDKYLLIPGLLCFVLTILITELFMFFYSQLPPRLPLFYSLPWGQQQLVDKQQFLILPAVLLLINLVNIFIAYHLHEVQTVLKRILLLSLVVVDLLILVTAVKILTIFV